MSLGSLSDGSTLTLNCLSKTSGKPKYIFKSVSIIKAIKTNLKLTIILMIFRNAIFQKIIVIEEFESRFLKLWLTSRKNPRLITLI